MQIAVGIVTWPTLPPGKVWYRSPTELLSPPQDRKAHILAPKCKGAKHPSLSFIRVEPLQHVYQFLINMDKSFGSPANSSNNPSECPISLTRKLREDSIIWNWSS